MKLQSTTFTHNGFIPERCAFGIKDPDNHMTLGLNKNPQISWTEIPSNALSLILLCIDTDVPSSLDDFNKEGRMISKDLPRVNFTHWVMVDIKPSNNSIDEGDCSDGITAGGKQNPNGPKESRQGINDYTNFMASNPEMKGNYFGYEGPCPPWNDELIHHYRFQLFACDFKQCPVEGLFTAADVQKTLEGHVIDKTELIGFYSLNPNL